MSRFISTTLLVIAGIAAISMLALYIVPSASTLALGIVGATLITTVGMYALIAESREPVKVEANAPVNNPFHRW